MDMNARIIGAFSLTSPIPPSQQPALTLAYIGDTVFDLYVRSYLINCCPANVHSLHLMSAKLVCAKGQCNAFRRIEALLSEQELSLYKRGRNAHSGTVPKHAEVVDYRVATGFEALIGWLYLEGLDERLDALMRIAIQKEEVSQ